MPLIGIPSFIKSAGPAARACTHYFVSVRPTMAGDPGELPEAAEDAESKPEAGAATELKKMPTITTVSKRTGSVSRRRLCSFVLAFTHSSMHSSIHRCIHSFIYSFDDSFIKDRHPLRVN